MPEERIDAAKGQALLERLAALTDSISVAARMANWQEVARLVEVRTPLLMSLRKEHAALGLDVIRRIQSVDAAILADAHTAQTELQAEYSAAMQRIQSTREYHRVALY
jgi:flagellar protein FliT